MTDKNQALLQVENLVVEYKAKSRREKRFRVLKGVSLELNAGSTHGIVGESGSGKSTLGRAVLGLAPVTDGSIRFSNTEIGHANRRERRKLARDIQVVFQDPYTSLNPALTVGEILAEPLVAHGTARKEAEARIRRLLDQVHLPAGAFYRRPREFSGGQRQRVAIARALALEPALIICDEPVSALDLVNQARVLDLLLEIQQQTNTAYLFVSHDLDVIRHISHTVSVMLNGEIVEQGSGKAVTTNPQDPYTRKLLLAAPVPDVERQRARREQRLASPAPSR
ncbi:peptide/nickel transport system ATP-binding protein [Pseudarthrobacter sp. PvP004]|uniref:ABC transporter ATP-binding protein n=1 Tax=Pseudarthrobacter sp. PvP004 TaxID=2817850 RepID=UPI001AE7D900|nr:ATP-binding cassette domain-containing protein [Pseudarthrobacter sp. PvP004]MBP2266180.1 peptide/nickel transport system ATP-binding protein [Pseudarthrobacter sp. PvP004]